MQYLTPRLSARRYTLLPLRFSGLGSIGGPITAQQGGLITSGASIGTGAAIAAGLIPAAAVPFVGPAIAAAGLVIQAIVNSGCGQTCVLSSEFANQADNALQQNIEAYFAPRMVSGTYDPTITLTTESQQAALQNYQSFVNWLEQQCSNPQLGNAGRRCISDRQAGACTWRQPASSVPPWGTPAAGECWNWDNGYRAPIANDTNVAPGASLQAPSPQSTAPTASAPAASSGTPASNSPSSGNSSMILWGSAALVALAFMSGRDN